MLRRTQNMVKSLDAIYDGEFYPKNAKTNSYFLQN